MACLWCAANKMCISCKKITTHGMRSYLPGQTPMWNAVNTAYSHIGVHPNVSITYNRNKLDNEKTNEQKAWLTKVYNNICNQINSTNQINKDVCSTPQATEAKRKYEGRRVGISIRNCLEKVRFRNSGRIAQLKPQQIRIACTSVSHFKPTTKQCSIFLHLQKLFSE